MQFSTNKSIIIATIFGIVQHIAFTSSILSIIVSKNVADPLIITLVLSIKRFSRIFLDIPAGFIGDKFGAKLLFILSIISILISSILLLFASKYMAIVVIAVLLKGLSDSCSVGKIEAYIYNILKQNNKIDKFGKSISLYYFSLDLVTSIFTWFIGSYLANIPQILKCNIIMACIGCILVIFINKNDIVFNKMVNFLDILKNTKRILFSNKIMLCIMLLWGLCTFLGWQLHTISSIVMTKFNYPLSQIIKIQSIEHFTLCIGCILSLLLSDKMSFKKAWIIFSFAVSVMLIAAIFGSQIVIIGSILLYLFFFCLLEVFFEKIIDKISPNEHRLSITSIATTITIIYNIFGTILFGFLAKYYGCNIAWIVLCSLFAVYVVGIGSYLIKKNI